MLEKLLPGQTDGLLNISLPDIGGMHHAGQGGPEQQNRLHRGKLRAHRALRRTAYQEGRQLLVDLTAHAQDIRNSLLSLVRLLHQRHRARSGIISGGIFIVEPDDGAAYRVVGLIPVAVALNGLVNLLFQQNHTAEENGIDDLLLALKVHIEGGLAVLRLPRNVIHRRLFGTLLGK